MELLLASGIGVLTTAGVWLLLRARTFPVMLGLTLLSYGVNLFIFSMGRLAVGAPPALAGLACDRAGDHEGVPTTANVHGLR